MAPRRQKPDTPAPRSVPRLSDVARQVGVSPGLVSRILNEDPRLYVRESTRRRVLDAVQELGYTPNSAARALRQARAGALGLVVYRISNPIYAKVIDGAQAAAAELGYTVLLGNAAGHEQDAGYLSSILRSGRIDGLMLQHGYGGLDVPLDVLLPSVPTVLFNSEGIGDRVGVRLQEEPAIDLLVEHLVGLGHRRIGFIAGDRAGALSRRRENGIRASLVKAGLGLDPACVAGHGWEAEHGLSAMVEMARVQPRPTAIVVANANIALGVLTATRQLGIAVPAELSVCAIHDAWFTEHAFPALTCVELPMRELGREATRALIATLAAGAAETTGADIVVTDPPPRLNLRASTARAWR